MFKKKNRLSVQTVLPENFQQNRQFRQEMDTLRSLGFDGVELNIAHPNRCKLGPILAFLEESELQLTNFASGLTAKTYGLSLSHQDEEERRRAVGKVQEIIRLLEGSSIGIILGFFKGPKAENQETARIQFARSFEELLPRAEAGKVPLIVEATNRYESSVANSLEEAFECIKKLPSPYAKILPDTFHMNIEESDMYSALSRHLQYFDTIHLSDNNRYFPGFGALDFERIIRHLRHDGFDGGFAIEGQIKRSFTDDCRAAIDFLKPYLS
ncbi:MAG TPA: sugar phosphate isomerase/epimerase [Sediminispirochaeta sp.]|nr:sugar phosphate isomerase/epimerase [Sediminispirochaeta sp.]